MKTRVFLAILLSGVLLAPLRAGAPLTLRERHALAKDVASEILARSLVRSAPDGRPRVTRYEVAGAVTDFLDVLDNLRALSGEGPLTPIKSDPWIYSGAGKTTGETRSPIRSLSFQPREDGPGRGPAPVTLRSLKVDFGSPSTSVP